MNNKIENQSKFLTYLMALFFMATPIDYVLPHFGSATVLFVLGFLISGIAFSFLLANDSKFIDKEQLLLILLILTILVSISWAEDKNRAFSYSFSFIATSAMYCILFSYKFSKKDILLFEKASILGGIILIIYVFTQADLDLVTAGYRLNFSRVGNQDYFSDPNGLAARLIMPVVFMTKYIFESKKALAKLICFISLVSAIYVIFLTGSRAAVIMLLFIFIVIFLSFSSKRSGAILILLFLGLIAIILIPNLLPQHIYNRIFSFDKYQEVTTYKGDRIDIWKNVLLKVFPNSPLLGHGSGNTCVALKEIYGRVKAVHNSWLVVLGDLGLIGFIPWMSFVFKKIKEAFRLRKENIFVWAIMLGTIIMASTLDSEKEKYLWNGFLYVHFIKTMYNSDPVTSADELRQ